MDVDNEAFFMSENKQNLKKSELKNFHKKKMPNATKCIIFPIFIYCLKEIKNVNTMSSLKYKHSNTIVLLLTIRKLPTFVSIVELVSYYLF